MTSINKLTKNSIVNPGDLLVIWDEENQRTRSISYDTLKAAVPYLESAEYISPNLILTQSDGETITVAIPSGGDVISGLLDGQVPVKDQATGQLVYSGATVNSETGQWVFDRTIEVPSSSLDVGDVVTISEGSTDLLISNNIDGIVSAVVSSEIDSTGAKPPSYFKFGPEKSFIPQPFDDEVITTNPLIASSTGRVVSPDVRQINQTIFRADEDMPNVVAEIKDKASGMVIKYIPSRAAWEAETEEDRARNPGLDFITGDNVIDYVSREEDTPGVFNIGVSPFRLTEGQEFEIIIKADVMALKGISGVPYLAEIVQDGPEVFLLSEDDQYIDEIIAGNNVTVDSTNPKKPVISASGGSGGAGVTIDVDGVEITTGVDTLDFDSKTMTILDENPADGTVKISAKVGVKTNFVGIYDNLTDLNAAITEPKSGYYAHIVGGLGGQPDVRYEYQGIDWVNLGPISGDVFVDGNKSAQIITGIGLSSEVTGDNITLRVGGGVDVVELDVDADNTITLDSSYSGKFCSIVQSTTTAPKLMTITLSDFSYFDEGAVISIARSEQYTNYYFTVIYREKSGAQRALYPNNNVKMVKGRNFWDVEKDGKFTDVSIQPKSVFSLPYEDDSNYTKPVDAFVFADSDAIEFAEDENGQGRVVKIDLDGAKPDLSNYVEKYSKAELNCIQLAYDGKFESERLFYPFEIKQDVNGWTQEQFTGVRTFQSKDKNSGVLGDKILELGTSRVDLNKPSYVQGKRIAERTTHNIYNSYSLSDLINTEGKTLPEWIAENPAYTQIQFLNTLFSCTVLGSSNWIVSATTSGEDYNGTFPNGYQQIEIHRNGGGSRSFLRSYNKESSVHYFAKYKANTELYWKQYAYTDDLGVLKDKKSYDNEIQSIDTSGTGIFAEYLGFGSTSAQHTHTFDESGVFWISNLQSSTRNKTVNVISSNGAEMTGISVPFNRVVKFTYSSEIEEIITEASYANVDINSNPADSTFDGEGFGVPGKTLVEAGTVVQTEITGNYRNNSDAVGNLTINVRTDDGVKNWRFYYSIPRGSISARKVYVKVDEKAGTNKTINSGETWQCEIKAGQFFDEFFWSRITDSATTFIEGDEFNAKSGYSKLVSGGGSTHTITYIENGSILKISNATVKVQLLQGMSSESPHGYIKYINSHNDDVAFEWYDRNGNQVTNNVPSVCPKDTVVEIFADYVKDEYVLNFGQSKIISSSIAEAQVPSFSKFINKSTVTVDYPLDANGEQYRPANAEIMILDTDNLISDLNITVTSSDSYDGHYNSIGVIAIDSNGEWTTQSRRNGYRLDDGTNTYCVYSDSISSWVLVVASVDHNHIGSIVGGVPINLYNDGQLPESYGDYSIDNNLDSIESEYFTKADVDIDYHTNSGSNSYFTVNFGSAKPAGIIFFK